MKLAIALMIPLAAYGQMRDNRDKQMTCKGSGYSSQARHCDIREQSIPLPGPLTTDTGNGGVTVKGWLRNDVLIRSMVQTWADTDAEANAIANQISVNASAGVISATGPTNNGHRGWSVSYEIFVPRVTNLNLRTSNGGISVSDVEGVLGLRTMNGGIHLARLAGDVTGATTNGGVHVELMGNSWQGRQLDVGTTNGGVMLSVPDGFSAHVQATTVNGGIHLDFPLTVTDQRQRHSIDTNLGSGGALINVSTVNGGVNLTRS